LGCFFDAQLTARNVLNVGTTLLSKTMKKTAKTHSGFGGLQSADAGFLLLV
jgi:hypothetical protein